jgi:hypothetical protein
MKVMRLLTVLVVLGLAACAPHAATPGAGIAAETLLIVENPPMGVSSFAVYVLPPAGERELLAEQVIATQPEPIRLNVQQGVRYRFLAEAVGHPHVASTEIAITPGSTVRWNLAENRVGITTD